MSIPHILGNQNTPPRVGKPNCGKNDFEWEQQLELEIQAFAELLLDIHEYRRAQKCTGINGQVLPLDRS